MRQRLIAKQPSLTMTIPNKEALFAALKNGATLITPNNRLSNQLLHDSHKQYAVNVTNKPRCLPYQAFLRAQYKKARHLYANMQHPVLLSSQQQNHVWRQLLGECNDSLLAEVQEAWARCQYWHIDMTHPAFNDNPQTQQFQQWHQEFQRCLTKLEAITEEQLTPHLLSYPELFDFTTVIWACFDDYNPQQRRLQQAIDAAGCQQYHYDLNDQSTTTHLYPAKDSQDEQLQLIEWLKLKLKAGEKRIAVVVPELQTTSHRLQRLLQRHISPTLFNISLGQSLIDFPLVAHALQWLSLDKQSLTNYQARLLLNSAFLGGAQSEFNARSEIIQNCKLLQEPVISFSALINEINQSAPTLAKLLKNLPDYPQEASPAGWAGMFKDRLIHLAFPGDYALISSAYQCFQRFMMLFDELVPFSVVCPRMKASQALTTLYDLAKTTIFQPQTPTTPIQILGLLEASGCTFDSVWVSGLTDQCLPQKPRLSAFIPISIQREQLMPHATSERELQFAQQVLHRLQAGSLDIVFSYPRLTGDSPNLPSPLISHLPTLTVHDMPASTSIPHLVQRDESYLIPLAANEPVTGGTTLLANQAKCPFRAFAAHRLHAKPVLTVTDGPDLSERGQLIHKIMELLWQRLGSQQHLLALTHDQLQHHIKEVIERALAPLINEHKNAFPPLVQDVELSRLHDMVNNCLEWEKQRPSFEIEALEKEFIIQLAGMDFRVRIDRLDTLSTGKKWVIDYKSSLPINKPWNEERPEAPQLLLYTLLDHSINTLLFLQLKAGNILCSGLSEDNLPVQGIRALKKDEQWAARQEEWHQQLTQLASEFRNGHCAPTPSRPTVCQQCDYPNLCRIE